MIIMLNVPNLDKVSEGKYKYRKGVPKKLQQYIGRTAWKFTLDTDDENYAIAWGKGLNKKYAKEVREAQEAIEKESSTGVPASKKPTSKPFDLSSIESEIHQLSETLECKKNADLNTLRLQLGNIGSSMQYAVEKDLSEQALAGVDLRPVFQQTLLGLCTQVAQVENLNDGDLRRKTARFVIQKLQPLLEEMEDRIPPLMGKPVPVRTTHELIQGRWEDVPVKSPTVALAPNTHPRGEKIPTLSEALEKHIAFKEIKDPLAKRRGVALFIDWAGDKPVSDYSPDEVVDYRNNCLRKYPKNRTKYSKFDGKSLRQVIKLGQHDEHIGRDRIDSYISNVSSVFRFAVQRGWIAFNPASGLKEPKPKVSTKADRSFTDDELKKLFEILTYNAKKPSWYWSILISLHQSFRMSEICQLYTSDIKEVEGFLCFDITEEGVEEARKSVKNRSSCRKVPIHPKLIEIGFLRFVEQRRRELNGKDGLLFSNVKYTANGKYNKSTSNWFNQRFKQNFISSEVQAVRRRDFHGFRHTFGRYAKNRARIDSDARKVLMGHTSEKGDESHDLYTLEEIQLLHDELSKLDYGLTIPPNPFMKKKAVK